MQKTILITGASRGFGNIWAKAFLKRGDHVIATARNLKHIVTWWKNLEMLFSLFSWM